MGKIIIEVKEQLIALPGVRPPGFYITMRREDDLGDRKKLQDMTQAVGRVIQAQLKTAMEHITKTKFSKVPYEEPKPPEIIDIKNKKGQVH